MWYIYIIVCHDGRAKSTYVSKTKNFEQEKEMHEEACTTQDCRLSRYIKKWDGWDNFSMLLACKRDCDDAVAVEIEQYFINDFKSTLQKINKTKETIQQKYYDTHRQLISDRGKQYSINHREACRVNSKRYREVHSQQLNTKYTCECGVTIKFGNKGPHDKSKHHISNQ